MGDKLILNGGRLPAYYDLNERLVNPFLERFGKFSDIGEELIDIFDNNLTFAAHNLLKWKGSPMDLAPFQSVILETLWHKTFPVFLASRGAGKSWLLAVYCALRAMLCPGSKIVIVAASFRQSKIVFDYLKKIYDESPIMRQCVSMIKTPNDQCIMEFGGGVSSVIALPLGNGERIRGIRACVAADTLVDTEFGLIEAKDLVEDSVDYPIYNGSTFEIPSHYCRTNITNVHRIETISGYSLEFSDLHRIWTTSGWKDIDTLKEGDRVCLSYSDKFPEKECVVKDIEKHNIMQEDYTLPPTLNEDVAKILGYLVSEGSVTTKHTITFTNTDDEIINDYCETFKRAFGIYPNVYTKDAHIDSRGWKCKPCKTATITRIGIRRYFDNCGLTRASARKKVVPKLILRSPKNVVRAFLSAIFEGDGSAVFYKDKRRNTDAFFITYYSASIKLCRQLQIMCLKFGLIGSIGSRNTGTINHYLRFGHGPATAFAECIGFISSEKRNKCIAANNVVPPKYYNGRSLKIKKIERNIRRDVLYDVCMPITHQFSANGFLNHNTDILCDEYASIPEEIFQVVVRGFAAVSTDPVKAAKQIQMEDDLIKRGKMKASDRKRIRGNKIIYSGTAYYQFNHFWKLYSMHKAIIDSRFIGDARDLNKTFGEAVGEEQGHIDYRDYAIVQLPYTGLPKGFMDDKQIAQAMATMPKAMFQMEYECQFPTDSDGFFKRTAIKDATPGEVDGGESFSVELVGDASYEYVMGIDPARKTDNFAISIVKLMPDGSMRNVYCWTANNKNFVSCTRKIRELLTKFNIVRIAMDSGGGGTSVEDLLQNVELLQPGEKPIFRYNDKEQRRYDGIHILDMVNFTPSWIADANYGLAADIEHKRIFFPYLSTSSFAHNVDEDAVWDEIAEQINEMCMIVVSATKTGIQHFDLPETPSAANIKTVQRKDRYSALLLASYAGRSYKSESQHEIEPFIGDWIDFI